MPLGGASREGEQWTSTTFLNLLSAFLLAAVGRADPPPASIADPDPMGDERRE